MSKVVFVVGQKTQINEPFDAIIKEVGTNSYTLERYIKVGFTDHRWRGQGYDKIWTENEWDEHIRDPKTKLPYSCSKDNVKLLKNVNSLKRTVSKHQAEIVQLNRIKNKMNSKENSLKTKLSELQKRLADLEFESKEMKRKNVQLQTENKAVRTKVSELEKHLAEFESKNNEIMGTNVKLQTENKDLKIKVSEFEKHLAEFECKNNEIYVRNKILSYNSKTKRDIKPRNDIADKQKLLRNEFTEHDTNMTNWMVFTQKMNKTYSECKTKTKDIGNENNILWSSLTECKLLWLQQQNQMESIAEILQKLGQRKRELKTYIRNHDNEAKQLNEKYKEQLTNYEQTNETRIKLQNELKTKLKELNDYCDKENKLNKNQCNMFDVFNTYDIELKEYESLLKHDDKVMRKYREFDSINEIVVNEMQKYFENKWIDNMKVWYKWSSESIICWLKYLRDDGLLSGNIKLDKILQQMQKDGVDGNSLLDIDKNDLKSVGFERLSDRQRVFNQIQQLISKYPHPTSFTDEGKIDDTFEHKVKVPTKFKCPITKEIMKNPVITFDGHTYEKINIEKHLHTYRESPVTKEKCDKDDMWFTPNRKLKQKIELFLKVNP